MIPTARLRTSVLLPLLLGSLLVTGCDRDSGDGSAGNPVGPGASSQGTGRFLIRDATVDELLSFSVEIDGVFAHYDDGTVSDNLLSWPLRLELLSLGDFSKWMAEAELDTGPIEAIEISFTPFSYEARALDGTPLQVDALADDYLSPLAVDEVLEEDELVSFVTDLDLTDSLEGDPSTGRITFDPEGVSRAAAPGELLPVDRFIGRVLFRDTGTLQLEVEAYADDDRNTVIGPVSVLADPFTLFMDRNLYMGFATPAEFFTLLYTNVTLLEVHGWLRSDGGFVAARLEIEDQDGGAGATYPFKLRGTAMATSPGVFRLQVQSVPRGAQFVLPILGGLGDPAGTNISVSSQRLAVLLGNEELFPTSVLPGDDVDVKFQVFPSQPFPAVVVGIRGASPGARGVIADTGGLPGSFAMNLLAAEPAILAGQVEDESTDVVVTINANLTQITLGTIFSPFLQPGDLVTGLAVRATGEITGNPAAPGLAAQRIVVRPGLLDEAQVTAVSVGGGTLTVAGGEVVRTFGGAFLESVTYTVNVEPDAALVGEADGLVALADALAALAPGERLVVDVQGLGTDTTDVIRGYQILSFVE